MANEQRKQAELKVRGWLWYPGGFVLCLLTLWLAGSVAVRAEPPPPLSEQRLLVAQAAMQEGLFDVAERHLVAYLASRREEPEACVQPLLWLCRVLSELGRPGDILTLLEANGAVVAAGASGGGFDFWRGRALCELGRIGEVAAALKGVDPERLETAYAIGIRRIMARAALAAGNYEAARHAFAGVDETATNREVRVANLLEWAQAELAAGKVEACEALLQRQAKLRPATDESRPALALGRLLQGQLARRQGRPEEAAVLLQELASDPETPVVSRSEAWLELAEMAFERGATNETIAASRQILDPALGSQHAWRIGLRYGRLLLALPGELEQGAAILKRAVRENPGAPESAAAQYALGEAWLVAGSNRQAAVEFRNYLETYGEEERLATALHGEAVALLRLRSYNEAAGLFQQAAQASTTTAWRAAALMQAADASHAAARYEQASELYQRVAAMTNGPTLTARAAFMAADALERLGRTAAAENAFVTLSNQLQSGDELAAAARLRAARLQERREAVAEAIGTYSVVIETATNRAQLAEALLGRGRSNYRNYQFERAIPDLEQAAETATALAPQADYLRMLSLYGAGRDDAAIALGSAFVANYPEASERADVSLWLAQYHYNRREFEEAQQRLAAFAEGWPQHPQADAALVWAGRAALQRGEFSDAIALLAQLSRSYPASSRLAEARFLQAEALGELARFEEAILVLDEIINRYPESEMVTSAWLRKGDSLVALGSSATNRYEEALRAYEIAGRRPDACSSLLLQAAYKRGRVLEKLSRISEAIDYYYTEVVLRYQQERATGGAGGEQAEEWYLRAVMQIATLKEGLEGGAAAVEFLRHRIREGMSGAAEAEALIRRIEREELPLWPASGREQQQ